MRLIDADAMCVGRCNPDVVTYPAFAAGWNGLLDIINNAPTVKAQPEVHGRWIEVSRISNSCETEIEEKCSNCGRYVNRYSTQPQDNYCPNCGARMEVTND